MTFLILIFSRRKRNITCYIISYKFTEYAVKMQHVVNCEYPPSFWHWDSYKNDLSMQRKLYTNLNSICNWLSVPEIGIVLQNDFGTILLYRRNNIFVTTYRDGSGGGTIQGQEEFICNTMWHIEHSSKSWMIEKIVNHNSDGTSFYSFKYDTNSEVVLDEINLEIHQLFVYLQCQVRYL